MNIAFRSLFFFLLWTSAAAIASSDDDYRLGNDLGYIHGSIESRQHIYYAGDTVDIRIIIRGDKEFLQSRSVGIYLAIFSPDGGVSFDRITDYQSFNSRRLFYAEDISDELVLPGSYQVALVAVRKDGNPANLGDWYNGLGGLLGGEALYFADGPVSWDINRDGFWDTDYDRDGFYGDDDDIYEDYYLGSGQYWGLRDPRDWDDDDWDDDYRDYDDYPYPGGYFEIEGRITQIVDEQSFYIGTLLVVHDASTRWEYGGPGQLAVGRLVEVEGNRTDANTLHADEIEYEDD